IGDYEFAVEIDGEDDVGKQFSDAHVDPVKLAERVPPPDPTRADLLEAHEIAPLGIAMLVDEQADSERIRLAQQRSAELSLVDDLPPSRHVPTPTAEEAAKPKPAQAAAAKPTAENAPAKRAAAPPPVSAAAHVTAKPAAPKPSAPKPAATKDAAAQPPRPPASATNSTAATPKATAPTQTPAAQPAAATPSPAPQPKA